VTPSMLMVFTRDKRKPGQRSLLGRLSDGIFRRGRSRQEPAAAGPSDGKDDVLEPEIAYPKAAE
jgi:multidrug efflux pump